MPAATPAPDEQDPKRIGPDDPTVRTLSLYLRRNAEFAAKQEMERLIEEAKRQPGDAPKDL